jgi:hypothetical protein
VRHLRAGLVLAALLTLSGAMPIVVEGAHRPCGTSTSPRCPGPNPTPTPTPTATPTPTPADPAPVISNVRAEAITQTTADIGWHVSEVAQGQTEYGVTVSYGSLSTKEQSFTYQDHLQRLSGLIAGTTYHYRVHAWDAAGQHTVSPDFTFTTAGGAPTPTPVPLPTPTTLPGGACTTTAPGPTGADQASQLQSVFDSAPNGAIVCLQPGRYVVNTTLRFVARSGITLDGKGATLDSTTQDCNRATLRFDRSTNMAVRDLTVDGFTGHPGTYAGGCEWGHAFEQWGGSGLDIANTTAQNLEGDCLYLTDSGGVSATGARYHDSVCKLNGRNGVSVVGGRDVVVERVAFSDIAYVVWDMEPNTPDPGQGAFDVTIRDNSYAGRGVQFFSMGGNGPIAGITVDANRSTGAWGVFTTSWSPGQRRTDIVFTNNVSTQDVDHGEPARLYFVAVDRLTVTGNTVYGVGPCVGTGGGATAVTISGNTCP